MKRVISFIVLITMALSSYAVQPPALSPQSAPPHIEFKYYGFYSVIDYTCMINKKNISGSYIHPLTGQLISYVDKYVLHGVTAVAGWQWRKESAIGIGFSYLNDADGSFSQIPVFLEFRSHFLRNRITPFTAVQMGYSIPFGTKNLDEDYTRIDEGGITFGVSAGARFAISQKVGLNLYVGYQMIHCNSIERGFDRVAATCLSELYHHLKFGLGINF